MSSSNLMPFDFNGAPIRVVILNEEPWFVAKDVCSVLEHSNSRMAVSRLNEDDVSSAYVTDGMGREQSTTVVNESGLYDLVFRSDKPEAGRFRRWVFRDVLPQIRKTGMYSEPMDELDRLELAIAAARRDRARVAAVEARQDTMESHLAGVLGQYDEFTTLAYAKLNDLATDRVSCQKHGQRATKLMRDRKMNPPRKRQDATFGTVNVYPVEILEATAG